MGNFEKMRKAYSVGPLLYIPGLRGDIAEKITGFSDIKPLSVAICLEDTVSDSKVEEAEQNTVNEIKKLYSAEKVLPNIFVRVRRPDQITKLLELLGSAAEILTGFIIPKVNERVMKDYLPIMQRTDKFFMPIIESDTLMRPYKRAEKLYMLHQLCDIVGEKILNIRVGGNDFSGILAVRNSVEQTVYDIAPVANLLADISAEFSRDYAVSAPVWNYFESGSDDAWKKGMEQEIYRDIAMGFVGKTVIHPSQIAVFNRCMRVKKHDFLDAKLLIDTKDNDLRVIKGTLGNRMCEHNVHMKWAEKTLALAEIYGVEE